MKKYTTLAELLRDYRQIKGLTQADLAGILGVDSRSIMRWEKGLTQINREKEAIFSEILSIPFQVISNLNSDPPIAIFCSLEHKTYSTTAMFSVVKNMSIFTEDFPIENGVVSPIISKGEIAHVQNHLKENGRTDIIPENVFQEVVSKLPELNLMALDESMFYAGHICTIPLSLSAFELWLNGELQIDKIQAQDIRFRPGEPIRLVIYSAYADSISTGYNIMNRFFKYFQEKMLTDYLVACYPENEVHIELWKQSGLRPLNNPNSKETSNLFIGDFDMFLFGKTLS